MLWQVVLLIVGLGVLIKGADLMVEGASQIAEHLGIPPLVVGLTIVAFGTSAPELFVSLLAAFQGSADVAIGNVLGSNIFNILVIIGLTAIFTPMTVDAMLIRREYPIMLVSLALFWLFAHSAAEIGVIEGGILFAGLLAYLAMTYWIVRYSKSAAPASIDIPEAISGPKHALITNVGLTVVGLLGLVLGAHLVVDNATGLARVLGISELIIGITLVAGGTSLPELATTIMAARKGEPDLAIGNAVGSNIFNVFCVIGLTSLVQPLGVNPTALAFDFPFMFFSCFLLWPLLLVFKRVDYRIGSLILLAYIGYLVILVRSGGIS